MRISKDTINELKSQGIVVKWYPHATYDEFKKEAWDNEFKRWFEYSKSACKELNPPKNDGSYESWNYETRAEYEQHIREFCDQIIDRHCDPYEYTTLYVLYDDGKTIVRKENVKSKEITSEYVMKLVEKDRKAYEGVYGKFAVAMQRLCRANGYDNRLAVYPTTYGIGVWVIWNFGSDKDIEGVKKLMDERGIEYYNEYSEQGWVYRFKVSKRKENLEKVFC